MKRRQLLRHLKKHGCVVIREGANHTIYENPANGRRVPVGRHVEIDNKLVRKICTQLDIPSVN
jgi:mRNA interferase HicA